MRVVIVGAGQAGAALAAKLRALGHQGEIVMLGDEPSPPYQRPPLSKAYLLGDIGEDRLWLRTPEFWAENKIDLRLGQSVNAIETGKYDPSLPLAFRIADLFGLPIEEIFLKD